MTRIASVTTYAVSYPLDAPLSDSIHYMPARTALLLEVGTEDGKVGIGESAIYGGPPSVVETMIHDELAPRILGQEATRPEWLWQVMAGRSHQHGDGGVLPAAISGLDIALWDLMGQTAGLPLYRLLGGYRDEVPAYASAGFYAEGKDAEGLADEARGYVEAGFRHVKIKVGRTTDTPMNPLVHMEAPDFATVTFAEDLRRVGAVRKAVGDDVHLMVDANNAWTKPIAQEAGREFERLGIHWFEEPVPTEDLRGSAELAASLDVPIAGYETRTGLAGFRDLVEARAVDIVQPDVIWSGGITACRRIAGLAAAAGHALRAARVLYRGERGGEPPLYRLAAQLLPTRVRPEPKRLAHRATRRADHAGRTRDRRRPGRSRAGRAPRPRHLEPICRGGGPDHRGFLDI
jgi:L-alanine-DL-glutamate epimerase-like enolase superfamily enzyme